MLGRDQVLPMCALNLSSHLAVPTSSAGHSHSKRETELDTPLLSCLSTTESCSFVKWITF